MSAQNEGPECQQEPMAFQEPKGSYTLRFHNKDGEEIGVLDFNDRGLAFEGIADLSAVVFMDWISKEFKGRLEQEYQRGFEEGKKHYETNT